MRGKGRTVDHEEVRVTGRDGEHERGRHEPLFEQPRERRAERLVAREELGEGDDALLAEGLYDWSGSNEFRESRREEPHVPRPWVYCTDMMFAHVETATRPATICATCQTVSYSEVVVGRLALSAPIPHSLPKNSAATIRPLPSISSLGTTAK